MAVYLARDRHYLHRPLCVVKSIHYRQANMRHRIEREVHTLELLGAHPQIPNVLAYFHTDHQAGQSSNNEEDQIFYIVQSWLDGHPISQEICAGRPLSEGYVSKLLKDVLVPLVRVHEQGVVHQNLHPQHLIRRDTDGQIFLTEFGTLPKLARSTVDESGVLTTSVPVSPQPYSAPELLQQNPQPASDLYALGLIAIEALTGCRHQDLSFDPIKGVLWRERVTQGEGVDGATSRSLAEFIDRLVRHDWRDRFEHAQAALSQLKLVRDRHQIAQDSRFPTVVAAPGQQATAFGKTGKTVDPKATAQTAWPRRQNNLPYPLNLAVGGPKPARTTASHPYSNGYSTAYSSRKSNPYLIKGVVGSLAVLIALGIGVKTYRWGEYRLSHLPQSWSDWAITAGDSAYPVADAAQLAPLFSGDSSLLLQPAVVKAYWQMSAAADAEGIKLYALSGYRSEPETMPPASPPNPIDTQDGQTQAEAQAQEQAQKAARESARNAADYHTGYALDIGGASESTDRQPEFAKTDAYKWLTHNAELYGFELSASISPLKRGLLGAASDQPWHWRYVGDEASQDIFD